MSSDEKLENGVKLNIYDAAHGWRGAMGDNRPIRAILADPDFRQAWITWRGSAPIYDERGRIIGHRKVLGKRRPPTTLAQKREVAHLFGWDNEDQRFYRHLRGMY